MSIPPRVARLVEHFHDNRAELRSGRYNETQVRREFIDPFFKALGWDVDNETGVSEAYKDVIHEDAVKIGGVTKAPDYSFRVGGERRFFVEAKKPAVNLKADTSPAFQLRRYAWSANLPISILTDFEEFIVYDCRVKPDQGDRADTARVLYLTYDDYPDQWDRIAGLFARDAVVHGALDQYVDTFKTHKGVATVDAAFLREIEAWRDSLAQDIARRNPGLGPRDLNFAVQMTIDRIIFVRMAEDRGIEPYGELLALGNGANVYERLTRMFKQADDRYNSGLFHFKREKGRESPDDLTLDLAIGDAPLKAIFKSLYYPDSPYEFSVLPIEILGHVYEQFLGKVITLTPDHGAVVEEKPEVRKAGGVYYTPTYIVDYIVEHTVGKLLEGKTPRQVAGAGKAAPLRIVDPACGSGSFLIGAYGYLLDWYRARYEAEGPERHKKELYQGADGAWRLTTAERKRILLDHIYGVDIDAQAVEVTKLSLLLKVLEGENRQALARQLTFLHERALPDLGRNIQCGNSLIGPDFYDGQLGLLDDETRYRINVFDWRAAFPHVFQGDNPGFDAVIGNPPYIGFHGFMSDKDYLKQSYLSARGKFDYYLPFIEKGIRLLKFGGLLGYICPTNFMKRDHGEALRAHLREAVQIIEITDFEDVQVFKGALNYTGVFIFQREAPSTSHRIYYKQRSLDAPAESVLQLSLTDDPWVFRVDEAAEIVNKIKRGKVSLLGKMARGISEGIVTGQNAVFLLDRSDALRLNLEAPLLHPCIRGRQVRRYALDEISEVVIYPYQLVEGKTKVLSEEELAEYSNIYSYLKSRRPELGGRPYFERSTKLWYELWCQRDLHLLAARKIVVAELASSNRFVLATADEFYGDTVCAITLLPSIKEDLAYLLGLLNSSLLGFYYRRTTVPKANGFYIYKTMFLKNLPIRTIDFADAADRRRHDRMVAMVEEMLRLHKRLAEARTPHEKTALQHQIDALDRQIDALVYALYGLTDEEIRIVEGASAG